MLFKTIIILVLATAVKGTSINHGRHHSREVNNGFAICQESDMDKDHMFNANNCWFVKLDTETLAESLMYGSIFIFVVVAFVAMAKYFLLWKLYLQQSSLKTMIFHQTCTLTKLEATLRFSRLTNTPIGRPLPPVPYNV